MDIAKLTLDPASTVLPELKEWMDIAGLSKQDVADLVGCHRSQISRMLNGKLPLRADRAARLAAVSGIPIEKLVSDQETAKLLKLLGTRSTSKHTKAR